MRLLFVLCETSHMLEYDTRSKPIRLGYGRGAKFAENAIQIADVKGDESGKDD